MVTEADLLAAEDESSRRARMDWALGRRWWFRKQPHTRLIAGALMTAPAITIRPDATIPSAARLMNTHHIRRDLIPLALRLIWDIDGVVDVVNKLGEASAAKTA